MQSVDGVAVLPNWAKGAFEPETQQPLGGCRGTRPSQGQKEMTTRDFSGAMLLCRCVFVFPRPRRGARGGGKKEERNWGRGGLFSHSHVQLMMRFF